MASTQLQTSLRPPDHAYSVQRAMAHLNASYTTLQQATSSSLKLAVEEARNTSERHHTELSAFQEEVDKMVKSTQIDANMLLVRAQELSLLRHTLSDELNDLSEELGSAGNGNGLSAESTLLGKIETLHRTLKELEGMKTYVQVVHKALQLSEQSVKTMEEFPVSQNISEGLFQDYVSLQVLVESVTRACGEAKSRTGQVIKLLSFLGDLPERAWYRIKNVLSSSLISAAEQLQWPMPINYTRASLESRKSFESSFANLLTLQEIGEKLGLAHHDRGDNRYHKIGLYPLQPLVRPIALRFKYHFEGIRQTNRIDKPEWYFAHILDMSLKHRTFFEIVVQPLLKSSKYAGIKCWHEFTRMLLPILVRKLTQSIPILISHPSLLAHTVYQALAFDNSLREAGFNLVGTLEKPKDDVHIWNGTSDVILGNKQCFDSWLEGERKFADDQYNEIISSADAWQIYGDNQNDPSADRDIRPTNSARRVKALFEQITDRYRPLPRFTQKTNFLISVQIPILELYHTRISDSLDAFETLSSFFVRAVPGALTGQASHSRDTKSMTSGVEGAQRLVKAFVSARWMSTVMSSWGEDMFFLELWHEICQKSATQAPVKSSKAFPDPSETKEDGTIFEELIVQYNKLADRAESMVIMQICGEVEASLKNHLYKQAAVTSGSTNEETSISQTLLGPLACFSVHMSYLNKTLTQSLVSTLYRKIASRIARYILERQVLYVGSGRMNAREGRVVLEEAKLWVETSQMALSSSIRRVEFPWQRLLEAGHLLSLEGEAYRRTARAVHLGKKEDFERLASELGINELSIDEVAEILRARDDD